MYLEDISLHQKIVTSPVLITLENMKDFAQKYDPLPLHLDEKYAETTRFGKIIAPGVMCFMLIWSRYLSENDLAGEQFIAGMSTNIAWSLPVYAGDMLRGEIEVTNLYPRNPYNGTLELTTKVYNQEEKLVLTDVTEMLVARRPSAEQK